VWPFLCFRVQGDHDYEKTLIDAFLAATATGEIPQDPDADGVNELLSTSAREASMPLPRCARGNRKGTS
jgi:hypothetical protein